MAIEAKVISNAPIRASIPGAIEPPVTSVNGQTGDVSLTAEDVGALPETYEPPVTSVNGQTGDVVISFPVTSVNGQTGDVVISLTPSTSFAIPVEGSSISYNMPGITSKHELIKWNFSSSDENNPPVDIYWATYNGYFTITNNGGTTSETIKPVFELPIEVSITSR